MVDTVGAVSSLQACVTRCERMAGCKVFSYSSTGYTNCQVSRLSFNQLSRSDVVKDAKWDLYELRDTSGGGGGGIYYPSNNQNSKLQLNQLIE